MLVRATRDGQLEDRAAVRGTAGGAAHSVEGRARRDERTVEIGAVGGASREGAREREARTVDVHLEHRARVGRPACNRRPVEHRANQRGRARWAAAPRDASRKRVEDREACAVHVDLECHAGVGGSAIAGQAVEHPARDGQAVQRVLPIGGATRERVKEREARAVRVDLVDRADGRRAAQRCHAIERRARQHRRAERACAVGGASRERVQQREAGAVRGDLEHRARTGRTAHAGRPVERRARQDRRSSGLAAVGGASGERVQQREAGAVRGDLEQGTCSRCSAVDGLAVESRAGPDERPVRVRSIGGVGVGERVQEREAGAVRVDLEHGPCAERPAVVGHAVEDPVEQQRTGAYGARAVGRATREDMKLSVGERRRDGAHVLGRRRRQVSARRARARGHAERGEEAVVSRRALRASRHGRAVHRSDRIAIRQRAHVRSVTAPSRVVAWRERR